MLIENIEDLLGLYDREFVDNAVEIFPDRTANALVATRYLSLIRRGHDKEAILYQIMLASDSTAHGFGLADARAFFKQSERRHRSLYKPFFKITFLLRKRRLRANSVENLMGRLLLALESPAAATQGGAGSAFELLTPIADPTYDRLSPKAAQIFDRLRVASR